ncbi:acidic fibroblast growth factor intracellular-binding protein [Folsomia candida]|uniref:acidic fibroblast growth factor intracellular-binding protein n=1 Tax=Folsomia candida TaxID=158441 RepID=UPI000B8F328F|nr:acidic fibroblast growth factor intracellular-binding protein [Folsomia candida]
MLAEVDVFIGNHTFVDHEIFQLWIEGNSAQEAAVVLQQRGALQTFPGATSDFLLADVCDHYRTYVLLEKLLHTPPRIFEQWTFQMDSQTQRMLIDHFYEFDDIVMREILGNKLSTRHRKDLDKITETTGVNLRSCRRQFDNAKRIFKATEEMTGSMHQNIKIHFLLSEELAKKYCAVVFIAGYRFETNKKKLQYLSFIDFCNCAYALMQHWTSPIMDDNSTADIEREFLVDLRELRIILEKEKEHKALVCQRLKNRVSDKIFAELDHNFKVYSRTLINLAYSLHHNKSLKELFVDLVEKYIEPCKHLHWTIAEMKVFLEVYSDAASQLDVVRSQSHLRSVLKRFMDGISMCLLTMYHN